MRIIQILPTLAFGDAIGNDTVELKNALKNAGYETEIYAEGIDVKIPKGIAKKIEYYENKEDDIIIYHLSTGTDLNYKVGQYNGKLIIMYHNITPPQFFNGYDAFSKKICEDGLIAAVELGKKAKYCIADSEYNKQDLLNMGYQCPIDVLPILIAFDDFEKEPDKKIVQKYDDEWTNIVFTGRVVPNKCPQDIIAAYAYYKKYINPKSRLFLVGKSDFSSRYLKELETYIELLQIDDVHITGQVRFNEILAYYKIADEFVCASEHEGFCVPLVEAMMFDVPIIAYDCAAIGSTLGGSGVLLPEKSPEIVAEAINIVETDEQLKNKIIDGQRKRLKDFEHEKIKKQFLQIIEKIISEDNK